MILLSVGKLEVAALIGIGGDFQMKRRPRHDHTAELQRMRTQEGAAYGEVGTSNLDRPLELRNARQDRLLGEMAAQQWVICGKRDVDRNRTAFAAHGNRARLEVHAAAGWPTISA